MDARTRRRFTLQLTPLLDLLFIVLYAQYIDLQEATRRAASGGEPAAVLNPVLKPKAAPA